MSPGSVERYERGTSDLRPAAVVRQVLDAAGFDERRIFDYRFDHKVAHYAVMREHTRVPMPRSVGFAELAGDARDPRELAVLLERAFPAGFVIKPSLGAGSGDEKAFDVSAEVLASFPRIEDSDLDSYLVQERIAILGEYRVHTVEEEIVDDLILPRHDARPIEVPIRNRLHAFVRECLDSIPDALVYDTMCGWDVADTGEQLIVIEINYTGFHPEWQPGFQTSGFLQEPPDGTRLLGTWLRWMSEHYGLRITTAPEGDAFLKEVLRFSPRSRASD